jgi:hypothetical protein
MLSKTGGELMLVAHMPGEKSIALTMTKRVDVEIFVSLVFGALRKTQGIVDNCTTHNSAEDSGEEEE